MNLSNWKKTGQYFKYKDQYDIFYQTTTGTGDYLLLLHGFPTASWDWHKIWETLSQQYRLITLDFIGFGFSAKPHFYPYSILDQADLVEVLLNKLGVDQFQVLAHDYGDTVLQELLARQIGRPNSTSPWTMNAITLLNGGIFPEAHSPRRIQKALMSPFGILLTPFLNRQKLKSNFAAIFGPDTQATETEIDEFYKLMEHNNGKYIFYRLIRYMAERRQYRERWVGALQNCPVPLRLVNGVLDPISGQQMVDRYQEVVPDPDVVLLPNIGHYPQTEAPQSVVDALLRI